MRTYVTRSNNSGYNEEMKSRNITYNVLSCAWRQIDGENARKISRLQILYRLKNIFTSTLPIVLPNALSVRYVPNITESLFAVI